MKVNGGDQIEVYIELDDQPRTVEIPEPLSERLKDNLEAEKFFASLSRSTDNPHLIYQEYFSS